MKRSLLLGAAIAAAVASVNAHAALSVNYQFNGKGNWALDATGSNDSPTGNINVVIPAGATIERAFLYSSRVFNVNQPTIDFNGTTISSWDSLGANTDQPILAAFRTDVTSIVAGVYAADADGDLTFSVNEGAETSTIDGEVLVVVYSDPNEVERTIALLDGFARNSGDTAAINLANPLTAAQLADPNFEAQMSLGIGFGFQASNQGSVVDVNGQRLTSCAGGQDDGAAANGGLITVGGTGDDFSTNPDPMCATNDPASPRQDDEAYNLVPFLGAGDQQIQIDTFNSSRDDNVFFAGFNITAEADVVSCEVRGDCPNEVPVPFTLPLLAMGLGLLGLKRRV